MEFQGKIALITGASVGIGRAVALLMAERGADLILLDINKEKLDLVGGETRKFGRKVLTYECDLSNEQQVYQVIAEATEAFGRIDILINNAAIWRDFVPFAESATDLWLRYFDINVMGTVEGIKAVIDGMLQHGEGRISNQATVAEVYGNRNIEHYSATKGAIGSMTKALAKEVSGQGVVVNCVSPGTVTSSEEEDINQSVPSDRSYTGRTGSDRENAELICFLASDRAPYIAGQNIQIDGCRKWL